jgi:hypothetical protein
VATAAILLGAAATADAAPISGYQSDADNHLHLNGGLDSAFDAELTYGRRIWLDALQRRLDLEAGLTIPIFLLKNFDSFRLEPGARLGIVQQGPWGIAGRIGFPVQTGSNQTFRFTSFGSRETLSGGYFARGGFVTLEASYLLLLTTYIAATDRTRQTYSGFRNGFYAPAGGYVDLDLALGLTLGGRTEIGLRVGLRRTQALDSPPLLPFFAEIGASYAF